MDETTDEVQVLPGKRFKPYGPMMRQDADGKYRMTEEGHRLLMEDREKSPWPMAMMFPRYAALVRSARCHFDDEEINDICVAARVKAMAHYDPATGFTFNTYAHGWMRGHLSRALYYAGKAFRAGATVISLSTTIRQKGGGDKELLSTLEDKGADANVAARVDQSTLRDRILTILRKVEPSARRRAMYAHRYGLDDEGMPHTLEETAATVGITRERVRQITAKINENMRPFLFPLHRELQHGLRRSTHHHETERKVRRAGKGAGKGTGRKRHMDRAGI